MDIPQYGNNIEFIYTGPDMLKEATKAAGQFVKVSNATIGSLKSAQQGLFTIEDRDANTPGWKKVRVVSTVEFLIID